jgi:DNA repair exonuclease SbcCD ATPase subunit
MKYLTVEIQGLLAFQFSGITKITLTTESIIQLIIGANGSGKSSLLRELSPRPAVRTSYTANGYKILRLIHQGAEYVLTSDFSNRSAPHSFIKNGEELNEGGTTTVQDDLVTTHLGYTKVIEDLVTNRHNFAILPDGMRKTLLMKFNPFNLDFVFDHYKKITSAIRACNSNLAMLHERKAVIEADKLDEAVVAAITAERRQLDTELSAIIETIHRVTDRLRVQPAAAPPLDFTRLRDQLTAIQTKLPQWSAVDRSRSVDELREQLIKALSEAETALPIWQERSRGLVAEVNKYETLLAELADQKDVQPLKTTLAGIEAELTDLTPKIIPDPLSSGVLKEVAQALPVVKGLVSQFLGCQTPLIGQAAITRKRALLRMRESQAQQLRAELVALVEHRTELAARKTLSRDDLPDSKECAQYRCPLYRVFIEDDQRIDRALDATQTRLQHLTEKIDRRERFIAQLTEQLDTMKAYAPALIELGAWFSQHPYLRDLLAGWDILQTLRHSPLSIYRDLQDHYERSVATHRVRELTAKKEEVLEILNKQNALGEQEAATLQSLRDEKQQALDAALATCASLETRRQQLEAQKEYLGAYAEAVAWVEQTTQQLNTALHEALTAYDREVYQAVLQALTTVRQAHIARMGTIDHTLREQQILQGRYDAEVLGQISVIEKRRSELELMEYALSPRNGLPHTRTVRFLNALIGTMNHYIAEVFGYRFELVPLSEDAPIDYKFSAYVGDVLIPDISTCSAAQQEVISAAFVLAVIVQTRLSDYPLFLDEIGKSFDPHHRQKLLDLFRLILEENTVSQLFIVNHNATVWAGLPNADILVLNDLNIMLPSRYNEHAEIVTL